MMKMKNEHDGDDDYGNNDENLLIVSKGNNF